MFREFELVLWSCFSTEDKIKELIAEHDEGENPEPVKKQVLNHLVNTAYYIKQTVTSEQDFECYRAFFNSYFTIFEGKHTDWLLLNEPDMTTITPHVINQRFQDLIQVINDHFVDQNAGQRKG